ncbi:hypothetical protein BJX99DRAFT_255269 [Aspergillus californicus]
MSYLGQIFPDFGDHENQKADNTIPVVSHGTNASADINNGFGGKFVWLIASYHNNHSTAISDIRIAITDNERSGEDDLARGAGGQFRYIEINHDGGTKIAELRLLRSNEQATQALINSLGYNGWSNDINGGRGGDFLYLMWKNE